MKAYIKLLCEIVDDKVENRENFSLIKLENFTTPKIYYEVCSHIEDKLKEKGIELVAKLSKEKYELWNKNSSNQTWLQKLKNKDWIELTGNLTKWRNISFSKDNYNSVIVLMGTEVVEDKGGLEEFNKISPESLERNIGEKYNVILEKYGFYYDEDEYEHFNKVIETIFRYVPKDILKVSSILENIDKNSNCIQIIEEICSNLFNDWGISNIQGITKKEIKSKSIEDLITDSYKFSRRIGLSYETDSQIEKLENQIKLYEQKYKTDLQNEFRDRFPMYSSYDEFAKELVNYARGINIENIRNKILQVDFKVIKEIVKMKKSKISTITKKLIVKGEPLKAICIPILQEYSKIEENKRFNLTNIDIVISQIKLAGTKLKGTKEEENDDLKNKWGNICIFLGGIEFLINRVNLENLNEKHIPIGIYSEYGNEKNVQRIYPFDRKEIKNLASQGILISGNNNDTKSKIFMTYRFKDEEGSLIHEEDYEWHFEDNEDWINTFYILNNNKFLSILDNEVALPIGVGDNVNEMIDSISEIELYYLLKHKKLKYINIFDELSKEKKGASISKKLGEKFRNVILSIGEKGFFNTAYGSIEVEELLQVYIEFCNTLKENIRLGDIQETDSSSLAKVFFLTNTSDIYEKSITGIIVPPYHPIVLERIVERYKYLSEGFKEIFDEIKSQCDVPAKSINERFDRFSQLSAVTSSLEFVIGKNNNYIGQNRTLGYYSIFGESSEDYCTTSTVNYDFIDEEEEGIYDKEFSPISKSISKIIKDYINTYPSKIDGIRVAFYEPKEYKDIITGLHESIKELSKNSIVNLKLIVYTSDYRGKESGYFKYWIENNFEEDAGVFIESKVKYMDTNKALLVNNFGNFVKENFEECDLVFINNVMLHKDINEENISFDKSKGLITSKYPTVYLPIVSNIEKNRKVLISQRQFACARGYSQLMVFLNTKIAKNEEYVAIKTVQLNRHTEEVLKYISEKSSWTIVMDENIDKKIIEITGNKIISFATGKGYFGEINLSISSRETYLEDLRNFLYKRLKMKFRTWTELELRIATNKCINYAKDMDGAQILKAINPSDESINEYLAFFLTTKILNIDKVQSDEYYIRKLVSIDSHNHLFDEKVDVCDTGRINRPDFMLFEVKKKENNLDDNDDIEIHLTLIECKVANENVLHLEKAKKQIVAGVNRLNKIWNRNSESIQKRYWCNQLYRLLVYNNELHLSGTETTKLNSKLGKINDGKFILNLKNRILTYWIDSKHYEKVINKDIIEEDIKITQSNVYSNAIRELILNDSSISIYDFENQDDSDKIEAVKQAAASKEEDIKTNTKESYKDEIKRNETIEDTILNNNEDIHNSNNILDIFEDSSCENIIDEDEIQEQLERLKSEFQIRNIKVHNRGFVVGPDIIRASIELGVGVDYSKITKHRDDIQIWLSTNNEVRIFKEDGFIKLDIARKHRQTIYFKEALKKTLENIETLKDRKDKLYVLLGLDVLGQSQVIDLSDSNNPHLLIAGQTGSGKSVLLASMLTSMMIYYNPEELEFLLVDPKRVELTVFKKSPFIRQIATDIEEVMSILEEVVSEMNRRYELFEKYEIQDISTYNKKVEDDERLKRIVLVIDEYGVLMESDKEFVKCFETALKKLSQLARAAGIHLIICTQSPKADIITTTIRNNLPARIGLKVADGNASSLILDGAGCESLLGKGDMLFKSVNTSIPIRCKSPYINQSEIKALNEFICK